MQERLAHQSRGRGLPVAAYCLAAILALLTAGAAAAQNHVQGGLQDQNREQPVHIQAETLEVLDKVKTATFSGNVQVVQGDMTMKCRSLVVFYGPEDGASASASAGTAAAAAPKPADSQSGPAMPQGGSIRRVEARGGVTVVTKDQNVTGDLGIYDMKTKTVTLTGNVVISQGKNVMHGERVVVNTLTGDARVDSGVTTRDRTETGSTSHDRVRVLITPGKDAKGAPTNTMSFEPPGRPN
jgi:lipopolysaccharide export system protein LptA